MKQVAKSKKDDSLIPEIDVPYHASHIWEWFWKLNGKRGGSGFGQNPLSSSEVESWFRLHKIDVRLYEIDMIEAMDAAYMNKSHEVSEKKKPKKPQPSAKGRK